MMTVTKDTPLLCSFRSKIDEAVSCVPRMSAPDKFKAVQFWNLISQKLQAIVNSSAADINDVAHKMEVDESEKIPLETRSLKSVNTAPNCSIPSDLMNLPSNYGISNEVIDQYHSADIGSAQLLTSETFSIVTESSLNSISNISHLNLLNNSISHHSLNSCERNVNNYMTIDNLSENSCDTFGVNSSVSVASRTIKSVLGETSKNEDYISKTIAHQESHQTYESSEDTIEIPDRSYNLNKTEDNEASTREDCDKLSILKESLLKDKHSSELQSRNCNNQMNSVSSEDSECSKDSIKSDFKTSVNAGELDSSHTEPTEPIVSFVVSCSEEIITKNGLTPEVNEKCSVNCIGRKCLHMKPYTCSDCLAKFATKGNLIVHLRTHTGEKPYPCPKCSSSFTTKGNLKRHLKTHTGEKPYACTLCDSKFTEKKSLNVHMRRHTGEKPYECKECGKRFAQSGILRTHMAMHLNQKFHLCEHCGKSFRQRSQLHIHKLRHENVRKHGCSLCSSRFLTKGDLERHMRVHTGEKPFVCEICSKTYTRQQSLNEHINRHYGLRPYVCKYCSRTFAEMSACYKHVKQHEKAAADGSENSQMESSIELSKLSQESNHSVLSSSSSERISLNKSDLSKSEADGLSKVHIIRFVV